MKGIYFLLADSPFALAGLCLLTILLALKLLLTNLKIKKLGENSILKLLNKSLNYTLIVIALVIIAAFSYSYYSSKNSKYSKQEIEHFAEIVLGKSSLIERQYEEISLQKQALRKKDNQFIEVLESIFAMDLEGIDEATEFLRQGNVSGIVKLLENKIEDGTSTVNETADLYVKIGEIEKTRNTERAIEAYKRAADLKKGNVEILTELGDLYILTGRFEEAEYIGLLILEISIKENNDEQLLDSYALLGLLYTESFRLKKANEYLHKGLELSKKINNLKYEAVFNNNIGLLTADIYYDTEEAIKYFNSALESIVNVENLDHEEELERDDVISTIKTNMAISYSSEGYHEKAKQLVDEAIKVVKDKYKNEDLAYIYYKAAIVYMNLGEYNKAQYYLHTGKELSNDNDVVSKILYYNHMSILHLNQNNLDQAEEFTWKMISLAEEKDLNRFLARAYSNISDIYDKKGDKKEALIFTKREIKIKEENNYLDVGASPYKVAAGLTIELEMYNKAEAYIKKHITLNKRSGIESDLGDSYASLGMVYYRQGQYDTAVKYMEDAVDIWHKSSEKNKDESFRYLVYDTLAGAYNKIGEVGKAEILNKQAYNEAKNTIRTLSKSNIKDADDHLILSKLHIKNENYKPALEHINIAIEENTKTGNDEGLADSYYNLAQYYYSVGDLISEKSSTIDALTLYKKLNIERGILISNISLCRNSADSKHFQGALKYCQLVLNTANPASDTITILDAYYNLATVHYESNSSDEALSYLNKGLNLASQNSLTTDTIEFYKFISEIYANQNNTDEAINTLELAFKIAKTANIKDKLLHITYDLGMLYAKNDDIRTIEKLDYALTLLPAEGSTEDEIKIRYQKALFYKNINKFDSMLSELKKAEPSLNDLQNMTLSADVNLELGTAYYKKRNYSLAKESLIKAYNQYKELHDFHFMSITQHTMGFNELQNEKSDRAKQHFIDSMSNALKSDHKFGAAKSAYELAIIEFNNTNYTKAINYCNKALTYLSDSKEYLSIGEVYSILAAIHTNLGKSHEEEKARKSAASYFKRANDVKRLSEAYEKLGYMYKYFDNPYLSIEYFEKSLKLFTDLTLHDLAGSISYELGSLYFKLKNYNQSIQYLFTAYNTNYPRKNAYEVGLIEFHLGVSYSRLDDYTMALKYLNTAVNTLDKVSYEEDIRLPNGSLKETIDYNGKKVTGNAYEVIPHIFKEIGFAYSYIADRKNAKKAFRIANNMFTERKMYREASEVKSALSDL